MKPRALILTTEPLDQPGGAERYMSYVMHGLEARGYDVSVLHRENTWPAAFNKPLKGRFGRVAMTTLQGLFIGLAARRKVASGVDLVISSSVAGWFPLPHVDHAAHIFHGTYAGLAHAIRKDITPVGYYTLIGWSCHVLERLGGRGKVSLFNSLQTRDEIRDKFGYEGHVVWCPLDLQHFRPRDRLAARKSLGMPADAKVAMFAGHILAIKGFSTILALVEAMPDLHWLLVIRGAIPEKLRNRPGVTLVNDADYDRMPLLYSAADVSLCPSRYEPFGYVVAEALACGTPVVATMGGASGALMTAPPLSDLLIATPDDLAGFEAAIRQVLGAPARFRDAVRDLAMPRLTEIAAEKNWWRRFFEAIGEEDPLAAPRAASAE